MALDPGYTTAMDTYHHTKMAIELAKDLLGEECKTFKLLLNVREAFKKRGFTHGHIWIPTTRLVHQARLGKGNDASAKRIILQEYSDQWSTEFKDWKCAEPRKTV